MVGKCHTTFVPLIKQLKKYGKFSSHISATTSDIKVILDYMYSELIYCIENDNLSRYGWIFKIQYANISHHIYILTANHSGSHHVKSFETQSKDPTQLKNCLDEISKVYTCLFCKHYRYGIDQTEVFYREMPA